MITDKTIEEVRALPIMDVLSRYIKLDRTGSACCPFHGEKSPSFKVHKGRNVYKCFGCGASGDAIRFVQQHKNLPFYEAIEVIAKDHHIEVMYTENDMTPEERKQKMDKIEAARTVLHLAHEFYCNRLKENPSILEVLKARGYTEEQIELHELGYAPDDWKSITKPVIERGFYEVAAEIGLIKTKDGNNYDALRHRITIPIRDHVGQLVGFGARAIGDAKPKYLNPSESFIYHKSSLLFGLDQAAQAIKEQGYAILVEGYFDVIGLNTRGVYNVVAPCGTACDDKQLKMLKRYTDTIVIMYDGDSAGAKATEKRIHQCLSMGFNGLVAPLDGEDPEELAKKYDYASTEEAEL